MTMSNSSDLLDITLRTTMVVEEEGRGGDHNNQWDYNSVLPCSGVGCRPALVMSTPLAVIYCCASDDVMH